MPEALHAVVCADCKGEAVQDKKDIYRCTLCHLPVCARCGSSDGRWSFIDRKNYCQRCKLVLNPPAPYVLGRYEAKLERSLPKGHILGPKIKGGEGARGIFGPK